MPARAEAADHGADAVHLRIEGGRAEQLFHREIGEVLHLIHRLQFSVKHRIDAQICNNSEALYAKVALVIKRNAVHSLFVRRKFPRKTFLVPRGQIVKQFHVDVPLYR